AQPGPYPGEAGNGHAGSGLRECPAVRHHALPLAGSGLLSSPATVLPNPVRPNLFSSPPWCLSFFLLKWWMHGRLRANYVTPQRRSRSEEHTSELQSRENLVCRLLLEKKKRIYYKMTTVI